MYENAADELQRILKLIETCPEPLRAKAFELLLQGYVQTLIPPPAVAAKVAAERAAPPAKPASDAEWSATISPEVLPRLKAMAKRRNVAAERLGSLFDFSSDPFTLAPLHVEGSNNKERTRKVALVVAARSFLATGKWTGDWAEIKAMCTHQNCYDVANFAATLKQAKGDLFKSVDVGSAIELSAAGTEQAEVLLATLAGMGDAST